MEDVNAEEKLFISGGGYGMVAYALTKTTSSLLENTADIKYGKCSTIAIATNSTRHVLARANKSQRPQRHSRTVL